MKTTLLRSTSSGVKGTYENINHHAKLLLPLVQQLEVLIPTLGYSEWKQGNNIHVLVTCCGRQIVLRPHREDNMCDVPYDTYRAYIGIRASIRLSRALEVPLSTLYFDSRNGIEILGFTQMLKQLTARCVPSLNMPSDQN